MIPKKIHYCWFGRNPLPGSARKCIESWKKYFPDHEIIEWNEDNYDVYKLPYLREAYESGKYAYVSDYARYDILYHEGGIYFDTDVEVISSFDDILSNGAFLGCEVNGKYSQDDARAEIKEEEYENYSIRVNPGLGMATESGTLFYKEILELYKNLRFINADGSFNSVAVVRNTTTTLVKYGLQDLGDRQTILGINIYPMDYFNPLDSKTGLLHKTCNTHSIHWYTMSWMPLWKQKKVWIGKQIRKVMYLLKINC